MTSALVILSGSFKLGPHKTVNENESRYNPKPRQTSSTGRHPYISFKGSLYGNKEGLQWQTYYLSFFKVRPGRSIEIRIGKEGIYTRAWVFIISETIIDDQCHYKWWGSTLIIQNDSMRWEWLSFLFRQHLFCIMYMKIRQRLFCNRWPAAKWKNTFSCTMRNKAASHIVWCRQSEVTIIKLADKYYATISH